MVFIEAKDPEWMTMWEELSSHDLNEGDPICLFMGQCWEYMGSTLDHHHLRHSMHPNTGKSEFVYLERRSAAIQWSLMG